MDSYKKDFENAVEMIDWQNKMLKQQQAEIEELKTCLIVEQEHNERIEAILRKAQEK